MTHIFIFNAVLLGACLYAFWAGGAPERATAAVFIIAASVTYAVPYRHFQAVETFVLIVDIMAFAALTAIALRANRYWPIYESALQLLTVAVHLVKAYQPSLACWMYNGASGKLAYPTLILLAIGVLRHRQRIAMFGRDSDWSQIRHTEAYP